VTTIIRNLATTTLAVFAVLLFAEYAVAKTGTKVAAVQREQVLVNKSPWIGEWFLFTHTKNGVLTGDLKLKFENSGGKLTVRVWQKRKKRFSPPKDVLIQDGAIKFTFGKKGKVAATLRLEDSSLSGELFGGWIFLLTGIDGRGVELTPASDKLK
jgi:hypothetical protein